MQYEELVVDNLFKDIQNNNFCSNNYINKIRCFSDIKDFIINKLFPLISYTEKKPVDITYDNFGYKGQKVYHVWDFIVDLILKDEQLINKIQHNMLLLYQILYNISRLDKGHYILNKLDKLIMLHIINPVKNNNNINIDKKYHLYNIIIDSAKYGTLPNFLFWINKVPNEIYNKKMTNNNNNILAYCAKNSDLRLFKWILINIDKFNKCNYQKYLSTIINFIFAINIPTKFRFKRLRLLNKYFNLVPMYSLLLQNCTTMKELLIILRFYKKNQKLKKYDYYHIVDIMTMENDDTLYTFTQIHYNYNMISKYLFSFEKYVLYFIMFDRQGCSLNLLNIDKQLNINFDNFIIIDLDIIIVDIIKIYFETKTVTCPLCGKPKYKCINPIFQLIASDDKSSYILMNSNLINLNDTHDVYKKLIFMLSNFKQYQIQLLLSKQNNDIRQKLEGKIPILFSFLQKKINKYLINKNKYAKNVYNLVLNNLLTFKPHKNIPILSNGSKMYQINKQKFTKKRVPIHLQPNDISVLKLKEHLLREKADGTMVNILPVSIYPNNNKIKETFVKAELIDDDEIYYVFDIDINMTIKNRQKYLRYNHPYTKEYPDMWYINTWEELMESIQTERYLVSKFIKETKKEKNRWYPKAAWYIPPNAKIWNQFIDKMILGKKTDLEEYLNNGPFECDGFILQSILENTEIKIKPLFLHTIDLLWKNNKWLDRQNNEIFNVFPNASIKLQNNTIWRCYPHENNRWEAREFRCDKTQPNPSNVVNMIKKLINTNWIKTNKKYYYQIKNNNINNELILLLKKQYNNLDNIINIIKPKCNTKWLDLGCGKGKLIRIINKYKPELYYGTDIDEKQLLYLNNKFNNNYIKTELVDLAKSWDKFNFNKTKYDYIISNFSLPHYWNEQLINNINMISKPGTVFMFNYVPYSDRQYKCNFYNSWIKVNKNKVEYLFEWCHSTSMQEPALNIKEIEIMFKNWKIINIPIKATFTSLSQFYNWIILRKN